MNRLGIASLLLFLLGPTLWGEVGATLFQQGNKRLSVNAGYGSFHDKDYFILGAGAGYYVWNGLEVGVDSEAWLGSKPHIYEVSPRLTYVFYQSEQYKPYVGGFYRHTFYDVLRPRDSAGARAGVIFPIGERTTLSAGLVYESFFQCDETLYGKCSQVYPELAIGFSF